MRGFWTDPLAGAGAGLGRGAAGGLSAAAILNDSRAMTRLAILAALLAGACASAHPAPISYGGGDRAQPRDRARPQRSAPETETPAPARAAVAQPTPNWADGEGTPL